VQTTWAYISNNFIYSAMGVFALSFLAHAFETAWAVKVPAEGSNARTMDYAKADRAARIATALMLLAFILLLVAVVARGLSNGHVPWGNMYEFSITGALTFTGAYLAALRKYDLRWLGLFISLAALLTLGTAITLLYRDSAPLVPALKSTWLIIQLSYRLVAFVFPLWTFSVIAGAIWAESAWGRYWGWDPKETWAFITWVAYAAYLHARVTVGWKGRRAAWLCLFAGSTFLFNYVYVNVWGTGKHTYSGL
jgi:ABC-type transport system involved in cytochrome c biogenesis permease subunit